MGDTIDKKKSHKFKINDSITSFKVRESTFINEDEGKKH